MLRGFEPILFLTGRCTVSVRAEYRTALLDLCLCEGVNYTAFFCGEDGGISFAVSIFTARRIKKRCAELGIELTVTQVGGLPQLLYRHRRRAGLMLGAIVGCLLLFWSGRFVWHVQVTGNESLSSDEVVEELRAVGFGVGSYIPALDTPRLENRLLLASDRISWVSVYLDGTVARVQIIEEIDTPQNEPITRPANLVATADGQIEVLELLRGNCVVSVGQAVKKGELLVSGVYDSSIYGYRYTRAAGRVLARTEQSFAVTVPLNDRKKVYGAPKTCEIVLNFFNFSLKIFKSTGNLPITCDIIEEERTVCAWGRYPLPVTLTVKKALPYTEADFTRTPDEALELAFEQLAGDLSRLSEEAQILQKNISTTITDTALTLDCSVLCIENIAEQVEFDVLEKP
jgi:similar to stage IV sporulation protein